MANVVENTRFKLRKNFFTRDDGLVESRTDFHSKGWRCIEKPRLEKAHQMEELYVRASKGENIGLMNCAPAIGQEFKRNSESVEPERFSPTLLDVEWKAVEASPGLGQPLRIHAQYILESLGLPFEGVRYFIARSSSNGVKNYRKEEDYRFHLWVWLDQKLNEEEHKLLFRDQKALDFSVWETSRIIFIAPGKDDSSVEREAFDEVFFSQEGRAIRCDEIQESVPSVEFIKARRAAGIKDFQNYHAKTWGLLNDHFEGEVPLNNRAKIFDAFSKLAEQDKLRSNATNYWLIDYCLKNDGHAEEAWRFLEANPAVNRGRTREDFESKVRRVKERLCQANDIVPLESEYSPDKKLIVPQPFNPDKAPLEWFPSSGVVHLPWAEGSGKTRFVGRLIKHWQNSLGAESVLLTCFRRAALSATTEDWRELGIEIDYYEDLQKKDIHLSKKLAINILSLKYTLSNGRIVPRKIVFADEIEHTLEELVLEAGEQGRLENRYEKQNAFNSLISHCSHADLLITADASSTGLLTGWFLSEVVNYKKGAKYLAVHQKDFIADKEITLFDSREDLFLEMIHSVKEGKACALHIDVGNDRGRLDAIASTCEAMGIERNAISVNYPENFAFQDERTHYKNSPNQSISRLYEEGVRLFINSPFTGIGWSYTGEEVDEIYGCFSENLFAAADIKQFIRRERLPSKIKLHIQGRSSRADNDVLESLYELLTSNGVIATDAYEQLCARGKIKKSVSMECVIQSFIALILESGGNFVPRTRVFEEKEKKSIAQLLKAENKEAREQVLAEAKKREKITREFLDWKGREVNWMLPSTNEIDWMQTWTKKFGGESFRVMIDLFKTPPQFRTWEMKDGNSEAQAAFLLGITVFDYVERIFQAENEGSGILNFISNPEKTRLRATCEKGEPAFDEFTNFLEKNKIRLAQDLYPHFKIDDFSYAPHRIIKKITEWFGLKFSTRPKGSALKEMELTKGEVQKTLWNKYGIRSGKVGDKQTKLFRLLRHKKELSDIESAWLNSLAREVFIEKHAFIPSEIWRSMELGSDDCSVAESQKNSNFSKSFLGEMQIFQAKKGSS